MSDAIRMLSLLREYRDAGLHVLTADQGAPGSSASPRPEAGPLMATVAWTHGGYARRHLSLAHRTDDGEQTLCGFKVPEIATNVRRGDEIEPTRKPCAICIAIDRDREGVLVDA